MHSLLIRIYEELLLMTVDHDDIKGLYRFALDSFDIDIYQPILKEYTMRPTVHLMRQTGATTVHLLDMLYRAYQLLKVPSEHNRYIDYVCIHHQQSKQLWKQVMTWLQMETSPFKDIIEAHPQTNICLKADGIMSPTFITPDNPQSKHYPFSRTIVWITFPTIDIRDAHQFRGRIHGEESFIKIDPQRWWF